MTAPVGATSMTIPWMFGALYKFITIIIIIIIIVVVVVDVVAAAA